MTTQYFNGRRFTPCPISALFEGDTIMQQFGIVETVKKVTAKTLTTEHDGMTARTAYHPLEKVLVERW
jgi:hypothetical protein